MSSSRERVLRSLLWARWPACCRRGALSRRPIPASAARRRRRNSRPGTSTCGRTSRVCRRAPAAWPRAWRSGRPSARPATASSARATRSSRRWSAARPTEDVKTGRVARLTRRGLPGRTTLMKVSTVSTLWDYINRAMPWNDAQVAERRRGLRRHGLPAQPGRRAAGRLHAVRPQHRRGAAALPNRNGMTTRPRHVARQRPRQRRQARRQRRGLHEGLRRRSRR